MVSKTDIENFYIKKGEGYPLILLHGNNENSSYFRYQIEEFSKDYQVYAIDTRGHGNSPRGDKPFTLNQFAQDLSDFMDNHNLERAHLLGFSDGGNIAVIFSILHQNRVEKLILNGANLFPKGIKPLIRLADRINYDFTRFFTKNTKKLEMLDLMVNQPYINPEGLSKIKSKTLVIAGTKDMIKKEHTELIARNIPNSKIVFLNGNHFVVYNNSYEYNKIILNFLKEN